MLNTIVFIDGQNLIHSCQAAFSIPYPDFDPKKLAHKICELKGLECGEVRFYTGVHEETEEPGWSAFWKQKFLTMNRDGVKVTHRKLRYREETIPIGGGNTIVRKVPREKGIDVRIALDIVAAVYDQKCENIVVFSQDQDLAEAIQEGIRIARQQGRTVGMYSAFPTGVTARDAGGLARTKQLPFDWDVYKDCKDPKAYPKP